MKKLLSIILFFAATILIFSACSASEKDQSGYLPYTAYISASGTEGVGSVVDAARRYTYLRDDDIPAPQSTTFSSKIMGVDYTANYDSKQIRAVFEPTYTYKTEDGDKITVDMSGNVVVFETARYTSLFHTEADADNCLTPEEALTKATEYLSQIFGSQLAAEYSGELPDVWANSIRVRFRRIYAGFDPYTTTDKIIIKISTEGDFLSFEAYNVGKYENKKLPDDFNDSKITEIIKKSLIDSATTIELSSEAKNLIILSDGRLACSTCFRINDNGAVGEWVSVIIPLE